MEFRQLRYFLAVAEEGQITKAAKRLNITQPPLSQQLILLERELGVKLIERNKKQICLTEAGYLLQSRAEQILELVKTTVNDLQDVSDGVKGKLMIGTITSSGRSIIPEHIQFFHKRYPKISFDLKQGETRKILELLNSGIIELGIVRFPFDSETYDYITLPDEPMVAVAAPGVCEQSAEQNLRLDDLRDEDLLIHRRHETIILEYCQQMGFQPSILCTSDDITPLLIWANLGIGVAIVPKSSVHLLAGSSLKVREITSPLLTTTRAVIWHKKRSLSSIASRFIELFK